MLFFFSVKGYVDCGIGKVVFYGIVILIVLIIIIEEFVEERIIDGVDFVF